jgi:hypothetical protein
MLQACRRNLTRTIIIYIYIYIYRERERERERERVASMKPINQTMSWSGFSSALRLKSGPAPAEEDVFFLLKAGWPRNKTHGQE